MANSIERCLDGALTAPFYFGEILVQKMPSGRFVLSHRDDESVDQLQTFRNAEAAIEIAKYDDTGNYRSLKTAPNLRHGWRLELDTLEDLIRALDYFYPGRLAVFTAWKRGKLQTTPLRETLNRQSGMYRVAAKISDSQIDDLVADFCRSNGGCLRTVLWKRDQGGAIASTKLPKEKFDPKYDQAGIWPESPTPATVPLLCQEACNLLIAECRKVVKGE
jgi:sirohydrochlorin cobaltochelatase